MKTLKRPADISEFDWQALVAVGDRVLFAYRVRTKRAEEAVDQAVFGKGHGIPQQTISEWERGHRVHVTTEMLRLAAKLLLVFDPAQLFDQPTDTHTPEGRVYWGAVAAALAAHRAGTPLPRVPALLKQLAKAEADLQAKRRGE